MAKAKALAIPDDEEIKLEIKRALLEIVRNATGERRISYECEFHPKYTGNGRGYKHQINLPVKDASAVVSAARELLDRMEGRAATKKEAPRVKTAGRQLDELTDEELQALISEGEANGETHSEAAEEAAV